MANELSELPEILLSALRKSVAAFDRFKIHYALIGGLAASSRSRPRFTNDVDFLLEVPQVTLPLLLVELRRHGLTFSDDAVIREWVRENMTVLEYRGVRIDWLKTVVPPYARIVATATCDSSLGESVRVATAEGIILTKLTAMRGQDILDIQSLLASHPGQIDLELIRREWSTLGDTDDPRLQQFEQFVQDYYRAGP